jgi:preprotein translocase subunit YajC
MFNSIAYAADAPAAQGSPFAPLLMMVVIFGIFYFLLIRPQQKKQKEHVNMLNAIKAGDELITGGGIYCKVTKVLDNNTFLVEIADGITVKLTKNGIAQKVTEQEKK